MDPLKPAAGGGTEATTGAHIGKSVVIKGELSGSEDLIVEGEVEGSIVLNGHSLTVGQNGRVRASVKARQVVVAGRVEGNISSGDRLDLRKTATVLGDVQTQHLAIEDGAYLKGKVETMRENRLEPKAAAAAAIPGATAQPGNAAESKV